MEGESELAFRTVLFLGTFGMLSMASAIVVFIYLYQRKLIKKKLEYQAIERLLKQQEIKSAYALLEGQDGERKRIAKELHDNLGSILVTLNMYADTALSSNNLSQKNRHLARIKELGLQASDQTRDLSHRLDSVALQHFGLKTAINDLFLAISDTQPINVKSTVVLQQEISNEISFNLYRIIQELVNNSLKHAGASELGLEMREVKNKFISLVYEDNGIGFNPRHTRIGMGLFNIESRVAKMAGKITISNEGKGMCTTIEIPLRS